MLRNTYFCGKNRKTYIFLPREVTQTHCRTTYLEHRSAREVRKTSLRTAVNPHTKPMRRTSNWGECLQDRTDQGRRANGMGLAFVEATVWSEIPWLNKSNQ